MPLKRVTSHGAVFRSLCTVSRIVEEMIAKLLLMDATKPTTVMIMIMMVVFR